MGTKNNPGKFDCYANADPDEPMFILLGRDMHAPRLVELWADIREAAGEDPAKVTEARECAELMRAWQMDRLVEQSRSKTGAVMGEVATPPSAASDPLAAAPVAANGSQDDVAAEGSNTDDPLVDEDRPSAATSTRSSR